MSASRLRKDCAVSFLSFSHKDSAATDISVAVPLSSEGTAAGTSAFFGSAAVSATFDSFEDSTFSEVSATETETFASAADMGFNPLYLQDPGTPVGKEGGVNTVARNRASSHLGSETTQACVRGAKNSWCVPSGPKRKA